MNRAPLALSLTIAALLSVPTAAQDKTLWNPYGMTPAEREERALACSDDAPVDLQTRIVRRMDRTLIVAVTAQSVERRSIEGKVCWDLAILDASGQQLATRHLQIPIPLDRDEQWREQLTIHGLDAAAAVRVDATRVIKTVARTPPDERLRKRAPELVEAYIRNHNIDAPRFIETLYDASVQYNDSGTLARAEIMKRKNALRARWERVRYDLLKIEAIEPLGGDFEVSFTMRRWGIDSDGNANTATFLITQRWRALAYGEHRISVERTTKK